MDAFPAFFPLAGRKVVVVGSGAAAENKARLFDGSPAVLVRLNEAEAADPAAYAGSALVFIASQDRPFIVRTAALARAAGAAVNVVDHPALCDFYTPAVIDRGAVVAAVGATGASPLLAAMLRNAIEGQIPEGAGRLAALFRDTREVVREALPDIDQRRAFLQEALTGAAAEAAMAGNMDLAVKRLRATLAAFCAHDKLRPVGRVEFVVGEGPSDLLSLRAARSLSRADVLIIDPRSPPDIAALARRDARRLAFADTAAQDLVALAGEGQRIVCVLPEAPDPVTVQALRLAGVGVDILRQAPGA